MDSGKSDDDDAVLGRKPPSTTIKPHTFIPLVSAIMERDHIKQCELSKRTGISETKISRILTKRQRIDSLTLHIIFDALEIDMMRALLAVGHFGAWEQYFDPDVEIIADLIDVLPASLAKARCESPRSKISLPGAVILAERLSDMIATNDREVATRRRERPIAGM